jgi:hypothetical protein
VCADAYGGIGFLQDGHQSKPITSAIPGAVTSVFGINNAQHIVGSYSDNLSGTRGFQAVVK